MRPGTFMDARPAGNVVTGRFTVGSNGVTGDVTSRGDGRATGTVTGTTTQGGTTTDIDTDFDIRTGSFAGGEPDAGTPSSGGGSADPAGGGEPDAPTFTFDDIPTPREQGFLELRPGDGPIDLQDLPDAANITDVLGSSGADTVTAVDAPVTITGFAGNDRLQGGAGNDRVFGGEGADRVDGGAGDDIVAGGRGNGDRLTGGEGSDTFIYDGGDGQDAILDFTVGEDTIQINRTGVDSFEQLIDLGQQDGGATVFDFGDGNTLRLSNTDINDLSAGDFTFNQPVQGIAIPFQPVA